MELSQLDRTTLKLRVTRIDRQGTDRLINLANEFASSISTKVLESLEKGDCSSSFADIAEAAKTKFCLYCLAIINCYATLENNRNEIVGQKFANLKKLDPFLKAKGINHEKVLCHKTMEEFRQVNNAVKHHRLSEATTIITESGKRYGTKQLESLYKRSRRLDSYLTDLFRKFANTQ
ncbi:hypothetical protein [Azonexus hydrophilus]|uniref:hypothetical protein n=1 Tax=Azonexus hydrophilus TaxID=418702 RepID=UPI0012FB0FC0|nr:hypothetical protein [Azonexus hydrophilus]